jgi:hypothetical protein
MCECAKLKEIEVTPEMIKAGTSYMVNQAFNTLTPTATSPAFIAGFCRAILAANRSTSAVRDASSR